MEVVREAYLPITESRGLVPIFWVKYYISFDYLVSSLGTDKEESFLIQPEDGFPYFTDLVTGVRLCSNTLFRALHNALEFGTHFEVHVEKVDRVVTFLVGVSRMIVFSALLIPVGKLLDGVIAG